MKYLVILSVLYVSAYSSGYQQSSKADIIEIQPGKVLSRSRVLREALGKLCAEKDWDQGDVVITFFSVEPDVM